MAKNSKEITKSTKPSKPEEKGSKASAGATAKSASKVVANPRIVQAMRDLRDAKEAAKSKLIELGTIAQNEQCSRPELVASYMEAYGVEKVTAEGQVSRMMKILADPETLEQLRNGEIDLKTAREKTTKKQANPSAEAKKKSSDARFATAITTIVACAKEQGLALSDVVDAVKRACKKAGV